MWIEEINRELEGRLLAIWLGFNEDGTPIDMPESKRELYKHNWRMQAKLGREVRRERNGCGCSKRRKDA